jgi:hypothetical protein
MEGTVRTEKGRIQALNINKTFGTEWLDEHCGCDFAKAMEGDLVEIEKMRKHFKDETDRIRNSEEFGQELMIG